MWLVYNINYFKNVAITKMLLLLIFITGANSNLLINEYLNCSVSLVPNRTRTIPIQFLQQLSNSYLTIHIENSTGSELTTLFGEELEKTHGNYIFNYDTGKHFKRQMAFSYVHVVYLEHLSKFKLFSTVSYNLYQNDIVFLIVNTTRLPKKFESKKYNIDRCGGMFLFNLQDNVLYQSCYYCEKRNSGVLYKVSYNGSIGNVSQWINDYKNFHQHTFNIAHPEYPPFWTCM